MLLIGADPADELHELLRQVIRDEIVAAKESGEL
jgi:hypothetical protein